MWTVLFREDRVTDGVRNPRYPVGSIRMVLHFWIGIFHEINHSSVLGIPQPYGNPHGWCFLQVLVQCPVIFRSNHKWQERMGNRWNQQCCTLSADLQTEVYIVSPVVINILRYIYIIIYIDIYIIIYIIIIIYIYAHHYVTIYPQIQNRVHTHSPWEHSISEPPESPMH